MGNTAPQQTIQLIAHPQPDAVQVAVVHALRHLLRQPLGDRRIGGLFQRRQTPQFGQCLQVTKGSAHL